jgi:NADH dehydrogenase [ubiquinone] 1 alpha subcomplex assembly factor 7
MTSLAEALAARIKRDGPIPVSAYMDACLNDPAHGYYRTRHAIGRAGDFITAPEISQAFGELVGLWCAVVWQQMGAPAVLRLVELGPGRGTLMHDALRAARAAPAFRKALDVHLVESNASLAAEQRTALQGADVSMTWHDDVSAIAPDTPTIVIANEFLDTLPVAQWISRSGHWHERCVGIGNSGQLILIDGDASLSLRLPGTLGDAREGEIFETRHATLDVLAAKLADLGTPLAMLLIDYGHAAPAYGDTLQAVRAHRYDDLFAAPGEADLTAHVDFSEVSSAMQRCGLASDGPVTQAQFLGALGIAERASRLMAANPDKAARIEADIARLMAPGGMGTRFLALGVRTRELAPLPGFF